MFYCKSILGIIFLSFWAHRLVIVLCAFFPASAKIYSAKETTFFWTKCLIASCLARFIRISYYVKNQCDPKCFLLIGIWWVFAWLVVVIVINRYLTFKASPTPSQWTGRWPVDREKRHPSVIATLCRLWSFIITVETMLSVVKEVKRGKNGSRGFTPMATLVWKSGRVMARHDVTHFKCHSGRATECWTVVWLHWQRREEDGITYFWQQRDFPF